MKKLRPLSWIIIGLNAYFLLSFFLNINTNDSDTTIGLTFFVLMLWLAIMNVVLYVIYRVTGSAKRDCPACGMGVKKGLTICSNCNFDFLKAATGIDSQITKPLLPQRGKSEIAKKFNQIHPLLQGLIVLIGGFVVLYIGSYLLAPYFEYVDNINCGLNSLIHFPCTFRYKG